MSIEAMKLALDVFKSATPKYTRQRKDQKTLGGALDYWRLEQYQRMKAIKALEEALAKQEQGEPVACLHRLVDVTNPVVKSGYMCMDCKALFRAYATPQQRTWVGLTDEQILADETLRYHFGLNGGAGPVSKKGRAVIDAVESAHGIKE